MSVIVVARYRGDASKLEAALRSRPEAVESLSAKARSEGALHHRIAARDGEVLTIDEWQDPEAYNAIYPGEPLAQQLILEAGLDEPPEVSYYRVISVPGEF